MFDADLRQKQALEKAAKECLKYFTKDCLIPTPEATDMAATMKDTILTKLFYDGYNTGHLEGLGTAMKKEMKNK